MFVQVGQPAPEFSLQALVGEEFKNIALTDYHGKKWVVLFFYPLDFTFVCPTEILEFSKNASEFEKLNAVILGGSIDSIYSHKAWTKELGKLNYPLLSDITQEVARNYGILMEEKGFALRGLFIIDPDGILRYQVVHDTTVGRSVQETLRVLQALQSGELCPVGWKPGEKTLGKA
jgi:peroxiredoxin (alkyl hydroperoxide reductase subunit C)